MLLITLGGYMLYKPMVIYIDETLRTVVAVCFPGLQRVPENFAKMTKRPTTYVQGRRLLQCGLATSVARKAGHCTRSASYYNVIVASSLATVLKSRSQFDEMKKCGFQVPLNFRWNFILCFVVYALSMFVGFC